ncbi:MAG: lipocalin family protein [Rikenellaceae bacterium]
MLLISISFLIILVSAPLCSAEPVVDNSTVCEFDLDRYMGKWYEVARFDNRYERNLREVTAEYTLNEGNQVSIINRGFNTQDLEWQEAYGKGEPTDILGQLKVSFFLFFSSDYNVMHIGQDYEWALVGSKSNKYLWILSRTPSLPSDTLDHIIGLAQKRGYNVEELNILQNTDVAEIL